MGFVWPCSYAIIATDPRGEYPFSIDGYKASGAFSSLIRMLQIVKLKDVQWHGYGGCKVISF